MSARGLRLKLVKTPTLRVEVIAMIGILDVSVRVRLATITFRGCPQGPIEGISQRL